LKNPFNSPSYKNEDDLHLIQESKNGNKDALNLLIKNHQEYIYNVSLKFFNEIEKAQDATQEVLIKMLTNLGSYDSNKSQFRTWLYKIAFNHFLDSKKSPIEKQYEIGFENFFNLVQSTPDQELDEIQISNLSMEIEEAKIACTTGMIMCLNREQRLLYIVGDLFEIDHRLGSEIFEITPANFRKKLSRARQDLYMWMNNRCGLVNEQNSCRCPKKTKGFIERGYVNSGNLKWNSDILARMNDLTEQKVDELLIERDKIALNIFKQHPFKKSKVSGEEILELIFDNKKFTSVFELS
jgi:RNA polymerase sigma factor (sigma-70 family)